MPPKLIAKTVAMRCDHSETSYHHSETSYHHSETSYHHSETSYHRSETSYHHSETSYHHSALRQAPQSYSMRVRIASYTTIACAWALLVTCMPA
jgi:hypothetical protein